MSVASPVDQGYRVEVRWVELAVGGMTCAACASRIERRLNKLVGVSATVNYATETASVQAPVETPLALLVAQVQQAGYRATPIEASWATDQRDPERVRDLWRRLVVALLLGVPLADLSITLVLVPSLRFAGWQWVVLALTVPVVTWCAWPFHRRAATGLRHGGTSMDTLVSLGIAAATTWSVYTIFATGGATRRPDGIWGLMFAPSGSVYLDVAAMVTIFVLAGRLFEARARLTAGDALRALARLGAKDVAVLGIGGSEQRIPVDQLRAGDQFVVRPGEKIAADGEVVFGQSAIDTSPMTGESVPVDVIAGQIVIAGTTVLDGRLVVRAKRVGPETQLAQLVRLVEQAQSAKAWVQRLADRISAVFVPVVVVLAVTTCALRLAVGQPAAVALNASLSVLIIACPCALGLATPTALLAASGRGAQLGIFLKGHPALEAARVIDTVVMDKTGTLTSGQMAVVDVWTAADTDRASLLAWTGAVEDASGHPIALAISGYARREQPTLPTVEQFIAHAGLGVSGRVDERQVVVGSTHILSSAGIHPPAEAAAVGCRWQRQGHTCVFVTLDGVMAGMFALADTVKPSAAGAVAELHRLGLRTVLLTGDNQAAATAIAAQVGVDEVLADVLPSEKATLIKRLQAAGRSVAMVGDGVNDAPALAQADLGLAVVTGSDAALGAADIILVRDSLDAVPSALRLARATLRTIRANLIWAFGYNIAAIPVAAAGLLNPLIASGAMATSSLLVVANSLRLRGIERRT